LKFLKQRIEFSVFAVIALCLLPTDTQSMLEVVALLIASSGKYSRICLIQSSNSLNSSPLCTWEAFCSANPSVAVSVVMSKQLTRVGIQTN